MGVQYSRGLNLIEKCPHRGHFLLSYTFFRISPSHKYVACEVSDKRYSPGNGIGKEKNEIRVETGDLENREYPENSKSAGSDE